MVQFESDNFFNLPDYACNLTFTESNDRELRMAVRVVEYEEITDCSQRLVLNDFSSSMQHIS